MFIKYTAVVLVALLAAAATNPIEIEEKTPHELLMEVSSWEGLGLTANVNEYVDNTIKMLVPFIETHGLDPMPLPDVVEGFEVKPLLITYSAWLKIHDGNLSGLVSVARSGDQRVYYFAKMLRVRLKLQFTDLEFVYKYLVQVMNIGPTGGIIGSLSSFIVNVDILFDFNNDEIHLQEFSLSEIGRLRVRLTGNVLVDWLATPVANVFLRIFDDIIMRAVVENIRMSIIGGIGVINSNVQEVIRALEAFN